MAPAVSRRRRRRGQAVLTGTLILGLIGFAALVVDLGLVESERLALQHVGDAAATAAVGHLDGTEEGLERARRAALRVAARNDWRGAPVRLPDNPSNHPDGSVVLGIWDPDTGRFTPSVDRIDVNAVQVRLDGVVGTSFARILGAGAVAVHGQAAAKAPLRGGASAVDCYLPIALPDCLVEDGAGFRTLRLAPSGSDTVGWGRFDGHPSASWVRAQVIDDCQDGDLRIDDPLKLDNGVKASALQEIARQIQDAETSWDREAHGALPGQARRSGVAAHAYGNTLEGVVPLFDGGEAYCSGGGGRWTGEARVTGFAWVAIYDVVPTGPARDKNLYLRVDTVRDHPVGTRGNGPDLGVSASGPGRMVP